jgi:hypothetical protein
MSNQNQISVTIPEEVVESVKQHFIEVALLLAPYIINLTPEAILQLPKMGDKSYVFVTKGLEYMKLSGTPMPTYVDVPELEKDVIAFDTLRQIRQVLAPTIDQIDDTMVLAGSEAYVAVLAFYSYIKGAAKANVPGAKTIYDDLSTRFPGRSPKKEPNA